MPGRGGGPAFLVTSIGIAMRASQNNTPTPALCSLPLAFGGGGGGSRGEEGTGAMAGGRGLASGGPRGGGGGECGDPGGRPEEAAAVLRPLHVANLHLHLLPPSLLVLEARFHDGEVMHGLALIVLITDKEARRGCTGGDGDEVRDRERGGGRETRKGQSMKGGRKGGGGTM